LRTDIDKPGAQPVTNRLLLGIVIGISVALTSALHWDYVLGDPLAYHQRMSQIFAGNLPYVGATFEHLPMMLLPMGAAWILGGFSSPLVYRSIWAVLTALVLLATVHVLEVIDTMTGRDGVARRWVLVITPLVPLAIFRNDPWVVLPAMLGIAASLRSRPIVGSGWLGIGALAKAWPLVLVPFVWTKTKRSRRSLLIMIALVSIALLALTRTSGFSAGRSFDGLHTETLGGAMWLLTHRAGGSVSLIETAGAIYVDAPRIMMIPGLLLGMSVAVAALWQLARSRGTDGDRLVLIGVLVIGLLLVTPLQSAQFLLWASPFIVFSRSKMPLLLYAGAGALALFGVVGFNALQDNAWWWAAMAVVRNVLIFVVAVVLLLRAGAEQREDDTGNRRIFPSSNTL
jgi:hypothetical protein